MLQKLHCARPKKKSKYLKKNCQPQGKYIKSCTKYKSLKEQQKLNVAY